SAFSSFNKDSPEGKKEIGKIVLTAIKRLNNKIEQSYWVQKLSQKLGVREEAVIEELAKVTLSQSYTARSGMEAIFNSGAEKELGTAGRKKLIEEKVISLILKNPDYIKLIDGSHYLLFSEKTSQFLKALKQFIEEQKPVNEGEVEKDFKEI